MSDRRPPEWRQPDAVLHLRQPSGPELESGWVIQRFRQIACSYIYLRAFPPNAIPRAQNSRIFMSPQNDGKRWGAGTKALNAVNAKTIASASSSAMGLFHRFERGQAQCLLIPRFALNNAVEPGSARRPESDEEAEAMNAVDALDGISPSEPPVRQGSLASKLIANFGIFHMVGGAS